MLVLVVGMVVQVVWIDHNEEVEVEVDQGVIMVVLA